MSEQETNSESTMELLDHAVLSMITKAQIVTYALNLRANVIVKFNILEKKVLKQEFRL